MKVLKLITFLLLLATFSFAHSNDSIWYEGQVVLKDGQALDGEIYYNPASDEAVLIRNEGKIRIFTTFNTHYFSYFDDVMELERYFAAMATSKHSGVQDKAFYEIILTGSISLLRKERVMDLYYHSPIDSYNTLRKNLQVYDHFVQVNGQLIEYRNFKKDVLPMLYRRHKEIAKFVADRKLRYKDFVSQAMILDYYNQLTPKMAQASRED